MIPTYHKRFAHRPYFQWDRCLILPFGTRRFVLCTRCSGMAIGALSAMAWASGFATLPLSAACALAAPAFLEWALARYRVWAGTTFTRLATGVLLGLAAGMMFVCVWSAPFLTIGAGLVMYGMAVFIRTGSERTWQANGSVSR
jgi:hypothetical protein